MTDLVRPLGPEWLATLDRVLKPMGCAMSDVARLGERVAELSRAYNAGSAEGVKTKLPLDARVAFSFPRDVVKGAAAVREIVHRLDFDAARPLRVVDLGAGLGAMTWGLVRALGAAGKTGTVHATLVDEDPEVLRAAEALAAAAPRPDGLTVQITTRVGTVREFGALPSDVVFLGQVLSELDLRLEPEARVAAHAALVRRHHDQGHFVVVVEPALRDRTRHLHAVRDTLAASGIAIAAPCLHQAACPALANEHDWCHEDLHHIDLPAFVQPIAKAAGLRWQGLTFSYLVLERGAAASVPHDTTSMRFRVTTDLLRTKGKLEVFACCDDGQRPRIRRLDRHGPEFEQLHRGDVVTLRAVDTAAPVDERGRVADHVTIDVRPARQ